MNRVSPATRQALVIGGAILVIGTFLLVLVSMQGCVAAYTDPAADGSRRVVLGVPAATIADSINSGVGSIVDAVGGWLGLGGLGGVGTIVVGLTRGWAKQRARAESAERSIKAHNAAWDEAKSESERDALLAAARSGTGPRGADGRDPVPAPAIIGTQGLTQEGVTQ